MNRTIFSKLLKQELGQMIVECKAIGIVKGVLLSQGKAFKPCLDGTR